MNENPGETPNPLNPNQTNNDFISEPDAISQDNDTFVPESDAISQDTPLDPIDRPMEKAPEPEVAPVKKKKTGLIVGIIACIFIVVACIVAAILFMLNSNQNDAVSKAMTKLVNGEAPTNVQIEGTINLDLEDLDLPFSDAKLTISSDSIATGLINSTSVKFTATMKGGTEEVELNFDEVYATDGNLYIKLTGLQDATKALTTRETILEDTSSTTLELESSDADSSDIVAAGETSSELNEDYITPMLTVFSSLFETIDGQWIKLPVDEMSELSDTAMSGDDNYLMCVANLAQNTNAGGNSLAKAYLENPFVTSSKEAPTVIKKQDPIYKIEIDQAALSSFLAAAENSKPIKDFYSCIGYEKSNQIDLEEVFDDSISWPAIYVEIDKDYNFTRLYLEGEASKNTADFSFNYPGNINVSEPTKYLELEEVFQAMMQNFSQTPETLPAQE